MITLISWLPFAVFGAVLLAIILVGIMHAITGSTSMMITRVDAHSPRSRAAFQATREMIDVTIPFEDRDSPMARLLILRAYSTWTNGVGNMLLTIDPSTHPIACDDIDCCAGGVHIHWSGEHDA